MPVVGRETEASTRKPWCWVTRQTNKSIVKIKLRVVPRTARQCQARSCQYMDRFTVCMAGETMDLLGHSWSLQSEPDGCIRTVSTSRLHHHHQAPLPDTHAMCERCTTLVRTRDRFRTMQTGMKQTWVIATHCYAGYLLSSDSRRILKLIEGTLS